MAATALIVSLILFNALTAEAAASVSCGAGIGDLRESTASKSACQACGGKLEHDASMADGLGYTVCSGGRPSAPAPAARPETAAAPQTPACGAGVGDLRESTASKSACQACGGKLEHDASMADGLGYTVCSGGRSSAPAPAARPETTVAPQTPACGAGVGDLRESAASRSACEACGGKLDHDASMADGLGYTVCSGGRSSALAAHHDSRSETTVAPQTPACGAGVGDLRESTASKSACEACGGKLEHDASMADGLGYTVCSGGRSSVGPVSTASAPEAGEGSLFGKWDMSLVVLAVSLLVALLVKFLWGRFGPGPTTSSRELTKSDPKAEPAKPAQDKLFLQV